MKCASPDDDDTVPGDPETFWRRLMEWMATWPKVPEPEGDDPPPPF